MAKKSTKIPKERRQYHSIYGLNGGLNYSAPTTMIEDEETPRSSECWYRNHRIEKAKGNQYFADTETNPLEGTVLEIFQFYKTTGSDKLIVITTTDMYYYDSTNDTFVNITDVEEGLVCRVTVTCCPGYANLVCRITPRNIKASANLVSRVTVQLQSGTANLVSRVIVRQVSGGGEGILFCRVTVT